MPESPLRQSVVLTAEEAAAIDRALTRCITTGIALSDRLDTPYPDDPRWTPWSRFLKPALDRASEARKALRAARRRAEA